MILKVMDLLARAVEAGTGVKVLRSFDLAGSVPNRVFLLSFVRAREAASPNEQRPLFLEAFFSLSVAAERVDGRFFELIERAAMSARSLLTEQSYPVRLESLLITNQEGSVWATLEFSVKVIL